MTDEGKFRITDAIPQFVKVISVASSEVGIA